MTNIRFFPHGPPWPKIFLAIATVLLFSTYVTSGQEPIEGTSLFTGVYYTLDVKSKGRLTWSHNVIKQSSVSAEHLQVVYDEPGKNAVPGGKWWSDSQWMLNASEEPGYYYFTLKSLPHGVVTWAGGDADKKYIGILKNHDKNPDYLKGGKFRSDVLWKIVRQGSGEDSYYNIVSHRFSKSGMWSSAEKEWAPGKRYVQLWVSKNADKNNDDAYLWKFQQPIEGTSLFTGVYYTLDVKSKGRLTWSHNVIKQSSVSAEHLQVVYDEPGKNAVPGGKWWSDSQWMLNASEEPGYYYFTLKSLPHGVVTWAGGDADKKYIGILKNHDKNKDYLKGGKFRSDALWKIVLQEGTGEDSYYNIVSHRFSKSGMWTSAETEWAPGKRYVQLWVSKNSDKNKDDTYLWKFKQVSK